MIISKRSSSGVPRGVWGIEIPPRKFRNFDKAEPNSQVRGKYICNNLIVNRGLTHLQIEWNLSALCPQLNLLKPLLKISWRNPRKKFLVRPLRSILLYNGYRVFLGGKAAGAWC
jgi:hypothetical protein